VSKIAMDILTQSYFDLFSLPVGFDLDLQVLAERYRELQQVAHPDGYAHATERERRLAMERAVRINQAYAVLKNPLLRADYLLSLRGLDLDAQAAITTDSGFLLEQMELREELEAACHAADGAARLADLARRLAGGFRDLQGQLAQAFATDTPDSLGQARELMHKLQFLERIQSSTADLEAVLADRQ
jgi:molecular chaperone HscB